MTNEQRAEQLLKLYKFDFDKIPKSDIVDLINKEISNYQNGSSEYIRVLCGYLLCIGDKTDASLLKKVKYGINFDVQCMIDLDWIECLENNTDKSDLIDYFINYYKDFQATDTDDYY